MLDAEASVSFLELTVEIVAAYISNNSVPPLELPGLISRGAYIFGGDDRQGAGTAAGASQACSVGQEVFDQRLHHLPRGWETLQILEATSEDTVQHVARGIPRKVGPRDRLPHGGAQLRQGPVAAGQGDGAGATAPTALTRHPIAACRRLRRSTLPAALVLRRGRLISVQSRSRRSLSSSVQSAPGVGADAFHHGGKPVGSLTRHVASETQAGEEWRRICGGDLRRGPITVQRQSEIDQSFDDVGVAVASKVQHGVGAIRTVDPGFQPDLAGAAANAVALVMPLRRTGGRARGRVRSGSDSDRRVRPGSRNWR